MDLPNEPRMHGPILVYQKGDSEAAHEKVSFVPKNVPVVGWDGVGHVGVANMNIFSFNKSL